MLSCVCVLSLRFLDLLLDGAVLCVCALIKVFGPALGRCCPVCVFSLALSDLHLSSLLSSGSAITGDRLCGLSGKVSASGVADN